jgi:hypothetical protein
MFGKFLHAGLCEDEIFHPLRYILGKELNMANKEQGKGKDREKKKKKKEKPKK